MSGSGQSEVYVVKEGDIITQEGAPWEGSLGFRIGGNLAVSNKHVLPEVGKRVMHRKEPWKDSRTIGTVIKTVTWRNPTIWDWILFIFTGRPLPANRVDASLIRLDGDVRVEKAFPTPDQIVTVRKGMKVYKRGRTTGETEGVVLNDTVTINVDMGDGRILTFTDVYHFSNRTMAGDSGGVNRTDEGIIGITFAGPESGEYGFGIKATNIMKEFGLEVG
ncbi:MAG: hypothetical protein QXP81_09895 [Nitrososphaerota archaeon]